MEYAGQRIDQRINAKRTTEAQVDYGVGPVRDMSIGLAVRTVDD